MGSKLQLTSSESVQPTKDTTAIINATIDEKFKHILFWIATVALSTICGYLVNNIWNLNEKICEVVGQNKQILISTDYYSNKINLLEIQNKELSDQLNSYKKRINH